MKVNKLTDVIAAYFVGFVISLSILVFFYYFFYYDLNLAFLHSLSVLLISCPCALGLATPIAIMKAFSNALKKSILIKNPNAIELLPKIKNAIFDKTGTLSENFMSIYKHNLTNDDFNKLSSIQNLNPHPISRAFKSDVLAQGSIKNVVGKGLIYKENDDIYLVGNEQFLIENEIDTEKYKEFIIKNSKIAPILVFFAKNGNCLGLVCLENKLKKHSKDLICFFKKMNKKCFILSGDNKYSVEKVAKELDVDEYYFSFKPEDKLNFIKNLNKPNLFVGDGLNDGAAIRASDVSIVMNKGSDLTKEFCDFIILDDSLENIIYCYKLSKKTMQIIKINLFWAFFYNVICIFIAVGAFSFIKLTPHLAALAMCFSSICVILNSLRIDKIR